MKIEEIYKIADGVAPFSLSQATVKAIDGYDNSGIILGTDADVDSILVTLDLTAKCADYACEKGIKLIITHHPAIYLPIKNLAADDALTKCARGGTGVISMHLNLDVAEGGIDDSLASGLGAKETKTLIPVEGDRGLGRAFSVEKTSLNEFAENIKKTFSTDNIMIFGDRKKEIEKVASFCGAGCAEREVDLAEGADVIVSADMKHHVIRRALDKGICVVQMTHYASENYGMKIFAGKLANKVSGIKVIYYGSAEY